MAGEGDLSHEVTPVTTPVDVRGGDEIAALGEIFNDMLDHAQSTIVAYNSMRARTRTWAGSRPRSAPATCPRPSSR